MMKALTMNKRTWVDYLEFGNAVLWTLIMTWAIAYGLMVNNSTAFFLGISGLLAIAIVCLVMQLRERRHNED